MSENVSTTNVSETDPLDQLATRTRATQASSEQLRRDINEAVGLYLKQNADRQEAVDYQRALEELLGSQHAALIQDAQQSYYQQMAQYCVDGPENGKHTEADPVMLFNGQFIYTATDVRINGAGMDFIFTRTYKNQAYHRGPLGFNWDHNYMREEAPAIVRSSGELREDRYVRHEIHQNYAPPEGYHDAIESDGGSFVLRTPKGFALFMSVSIRRTFIVYERFATATLTIYLSPTILLAAYSESRLTAATDG